MKQTTGDAQKSLLTISLSFIGFWSSHTNSNGPQTSTNHMRSNSDSLEALKQAQIAIVRTNESIIVATSDPRKVSFKEKARRDRACRPCVEVHTKGLISKNFDVAVVLEFMLIYSTNISYINFSEMS
jgi:hypothetical protein